MLLTLSSVREEKRNGERKQLKSNSKSQRERVEERTTIAVTPIDDWTVFVWGSAKNITFQPIRGMDYGRWMDCVYGFSINFPSRCEKQQQHANLLS